MNIFRFIDSVLKAKKGIQKPDELASDSALGLIEGYFVLSFVMLGTLTGLSFWGGFVENVEFLKVFFFFFVVVLITSIIAFIKVKAFVKKISKKISRILANLFGGNGDE